MATLEHSSVCAEASEVLQPAAFNVLGSFVSYVYFYLQQALEFFPFLSHPSPAEALLSKHPLWNQERKRERDFACQKWCVASGLLDVVQQALVLLLSHCVQAKSF